MEIADCLQVQEETYPQGEATTVYHSWGVGHPEWEDYGGDGAASGGYRTDSCWGIGEDALEI